MKTETNSYNGYKLIKSVHVWLLITLLLLGLGLNFGLTLGRFNEVEKRVSTLEIGREINRENIQRNKELVQEIKINLKILMEHQGLKYQEAK